MVPGIYTHGYEEVQARLDDGRIPPEDTMWFYQYSGWGPGQLENECEHGVWLPVATSTDLLIDELKREKGTLWKDLMSLIDGALLLLAVAERAQIKHCSLALQNIEPHASRLSGKMAGDLKNC